MQSSVTRSRTSITKSLPASFKLSIFVLSSESYIKVLGFNRGNTLFHCLKHSVSHRETLSFNRGNIWCQRAECQICASLIIVLLVGGVSSLRVGMK